MPGYLPRLKIMEIELYGIWQYYIKLASQQYELYFVLILYFAAW